MRSLIRRAKAADGLPDPAPSRLGYRYQRLMLTPGVRAFLRIGVPLGLVAALIAGWIGQPQNRAMIGAHYADLLRSLQESPQFMVQDMVVTGADDSVAAAVRGLLPQDFPVSSFDLDLAAMRGGIEALEAVQSASVRVGPGGVLQVEIAPRVPVAIWRDGAVLRLIDAQGVQAGTTAARSDRPDLPLIAGDGAEQKIAEALALYAGAGPLRPRVQGLVRMGERRWDIVLDRDQRILLPSDGAVAAFDRVIALNTVQDMLARDVVVVDMRNAIRPTLRMTEDAVAAMRRVTTTGQQGAVN